MPSAAEPSPPGAQERAEQRAVQVAGFDHIGDRYDEAFPHKDGQAEAGIWLTKRLAPGARVLDVGCGTGLPTARQLTDAGCSVTGIDISPVMLELAAANVAAASFVERDVAELGSDLGVFDAVVAFFSLLMLGRSEIPGVLGLLHDALVPGGWFALGMVEADLDDVPIPFLGMPVRVTGYLRDELHDLVVAAGFTVMEERNLHYAPASTQVPPEVQLFLYCRRNDG